MGRITVRRPVRRIRGSEPPRRVVDTLAAEEPLEIRIAGTPLAVTMRTPGHDVELATGFLVSEGIIRTASDVRAAIHCGGPGTGGGQANTYNVLDLALADHVPPVPASAERNFYTTSSCGVCGKASIEAVHTVSAHDLHADAVTLTPERIAGFPVALRRAQEVFERTGGLHAAGLFDPATGEALVVREDVGRHNAVDKVIGWAAMQDRLPAAGTVLQVSGRASFELVQKAVMAGIPVLTAVSAPSSLAVELADSSGLTLVGFVRGDSMNVYTHAERVEGVTE
ncbi:formate dehydrogenase accessory sulfurtransferase FdhD [Kytococcus sedentarius]|uniref:Sulfur carrier protein FdhD n=1 Tax=Kytococcus sedentarius (strain ATCC 14392 / DSM 20547 / JCM 11482 / CCUG 33030 / NBRC 15357 / NCTC 11040 / CCM 314 / 541) TaxID=478801 RepID=C7NI18_KYTSD|nr:formate dehydrogenase accessory sulfurtransferase FdhD [Kytococcus sedentarius]ACV06525.1 formate dehydrogenase family accessory protein FdhD [Kytococcus sedentarius DSM 20547]QQB64834.1 formate dehydrogenase accessory sulfurtransferase FdhD [Kytococcus sedentarius]STX12049.1 formate dehydrogenase accessory protein [Kytococcus sedentarius]